MAALKSILGLMLVSALFIFTPVWAKPDLTPLGPNIADTKSAYYDFKIAKFQSEDHKRTYKVWLAIPKLQKNESRPVLYMLDGNSVMDRLSKQMLKNMAEKSAPVLVVIGYDSNLPFESNARSIDYTPADASGQIQPDPRAPERFSGGSQQFRKLILEKIAPWVESQVMIDPKRIGLWGHSYGGLFVLDSLLDTTYFSHYFAASPSLSWAESRMLKKILNTKIDPSKSKQLWLFEGDVQPVDLESAKIQDSQTINDLRKAAQHLQNHQVNSSVIIYPNLSHGQVFGTSMQSVLLWELLN